MSETKMTSLNDPKLNYNTLLLGRFRVHGYNMVNSVFKGDPDRAIAVGRYGASIKANWAAVSIVATGVAAVADWKVAAVGFGVFAGAKGLSAASEYMRGCRYAREWREESILRGDIQPLTIEDILQHKPAI